MELIKMSNEPTGIFEPGTCAACQEHCCIGDKLVIPLTKKESRTLEGRLPIAKDYILNQEGQCPALSEHGCTLGDEKPSFCQIYPVVAVSKTEEGAYSIRQISVDVGIADCPLGNQLTPEQGKAIWLSLSTEQQNRFALHARIQREDNPWSFLPNSALDSGRTIITGFEDMFGRVREDYTAARDRAEDGGRLK
jgi:Fe-S-cluster containining protein